MAFGDLVAGDWHVWDGMEDVTYTSRRLSGDQPEGDIQAKRKAPTYSDLMGGVYTKQDAVWLVPAQLLDPVLSTAGERGQAKPGDTVTDDAGTVWIVLEASPIVYRTVWRLVTRSLVLAFDLRDLVSIERPTITQDAVGGVARVWPDQGGGTTPYANIPARVQLLTQEEAEVRGLKGFAQAYAVIIGQQVALTPEDRLRWGEVLLHIKGLHNPQRIDELPVLDCLGGVYGVGG